MNAASAVGLKNVELRNLSLPDQFGAIFFRTHDDTGKPMGGHRHIVESEGSGVASVQLQTLDKATTEAALDSEKLCSLCFSTAHPIGTKELLLRTAMQGSTACVAMKTVVSL